MEAALAVHPAAGPGAVHPAAVAVADAPGRAAGGHMGAQSLAQQQQGTVNPEASGAAAGAGSGGAAGEDGAGEPAKKVRQAYAEYATSILPATLFLVCTKALTCTTASIGGTSSALACMFSNWAARRTARSCTCMRGQAGAVAHACLLDCTVTALYPMHRTPTEVG
jgi:hypothetical protein